MKSFIALFTLFLSSLCALPSFAAPVRVYVTEINAIGVQNRDELKSTIQLLLSSRLNSDTITAVGGAAEAEVVINGTYVAIGKIFSIDAVAKTIGGKTLTRAFVQGEGQDDVIPAVGKLADKLTVELTKQGNVNRQENKPVSVQSDIIKPQSNLHYAQSSDIIRAPEFVKGSPGGWVSKRLPGAANLLAIGSTLTNGEREIFLAQDNKIQYFRQGSGMVLVASVEFKANEKIISLDAVDGDNNGTQEVYVTIVKNDELSSQVWEVKGDKLIKVADAMPYYFRALSLAGGSKKLYVQEMGRDLEDYYGQVYEATRSGSTIKYQKPIKMPRYGNIYSFNQFLDKDGQTMTVVINPDNYLIVYDPDMKEIWRSSDRFGGTALYFQKEDMANVRTTGDRFRWIFMNQKIQVTSKNEILVGKNDGFFVIGNARSYKKGAVYNLAWDGSSLEEKWRTKETQSYMPDFWYDEGKNELLLLQMPQKPGLGDDGAASLGIKKVE